MPAPPKDRSRPTPAAGAAEIPFKRKVFSLALFVILVASILNAFFGDRGLLELLKVRAEKQALELEVAAVRARNQELLEEIRELKTSPLAIERLAREELGLARPGEIVLIIRDLAEEQEAQHHPAEEATTPTPAR